MPDLLSLIPGMTDDHEIVGVAHQHRRARSHVGLCRAASFVADSGSLFHSVQGDVQQQRTDDPALGSAVHGRREPALIDHPGLEPSGHLFPAGECPQLGQQLGMVDPVERGGQVCVQHPTAVRVTSPHRAIDRLDRILTTTSGPEPVGPRLEPCLPLRLQRVRDPGLVHPVTHHRDPQRPLFPIRLGNEYPLDR